MTGAPLGGQSRKERMQLLTGNQVEENRFCSSGKLLELFFLGLDVPKLVILTEMQRGISHVFCGGDVMLMVVTEFSTVSINCEVQGKQFVLNNS